MKLLSTIHRDWVMKVSFLRLIGCLLLIVPAPVLQATPVYPYPLEIFTNNGSFSDSNDLIFYIEVSDAGANRVDFTFYNDSLVQSCIARIYFDDGSLSSIASIIGSSGVLFNQPATPHSLPAGNTLVPPFVTSFSVDSNEPPPQNGINPSEWLCITFNLEIGSQIQDVLNGLNDGSLRIGAHIIALPDGSSESAINFPEPATICLLVLGGLVWRKRL